MPSSIAIASDPITAIATSVIFVAVAALHLLL
jgi:hypothetical protein